MLNNFPKVTGLRGGSIGSSVHSADPRALLLALLPWVERWSVGWASALVAQALAGHWNWLPEWGPLLRFQLRQAWLELPWFFFTLLILLFFPFWWNSRLGKAFDRKWAWEEARTEEQLLQSGAPVQLQKAPPGMMLPFADGCIATATLGLWRRECGKSSSCISLLVSIWFLSHIWWVFYFEVFIPTVW